MLEEIWIREKELEVQEYRVSRASEGNKKMSSGHKGESEKEGWEKIEGESERGRGLSKVVWFGIRFILSSLT